MNKIIEFGKGNIVIKSGLTNEFTINYIESYEKIGWINYSKFRDLKVVESIRFKYDKDMLNLLEELKSIPHKKQLIEFREYKFDFTNYKKESLAVLRRAVKNTIEAHIRLIAV